MTWVNGRGVGSTYGAGTGREYPIPPGLLHAGDNSVVVNVLDTYRDGGLAGPASAHALRFKDGSRVPLDAGWKYRVGAGHRLATARAVGNRWRSVDAVQRHDRADRPLRPARPALVPGRIQYLRGRALRATCCACCATIGARASAPTCRCWWCSWPATAGPEPARRKRLGDAARSATPGVADEDANSGLVVTIDIGDHYDVHPPNKQEVGRRLARAARHVIYGEKSLPPSGPVPHSAARAGDAVVVTFDDTSGDLVAQGADGPIGFELCGAQPGTCRYADAATKGNTVTLRAPNAIEATRVRYCWADGPVCTLFDGAHLPAGPFEMPIAPMQHDENAR